MKLNIERIIIVILLIIIGMLATCVTPKTKVETIDRITIKTDTIYFPKTTVVRYVPVTSYVTVYKDDTTKVADKDTPDSLTYKLYSQDISDSLITGNIVSMVDGDLKSSKLTYTPKFPKYITETITKTETVTKKVDKTVLALGVNIPITDKEFSPDILLSLSHKKFIYQVGYNPLNKSPNVGVSYKLW
jgi:hypothetical protein